MAIGSVFLGDIQHRLRLLNSPTTPPASPPQAASSPTMSTIVQPGVQIPSSRGGEVKPSASSGSPLIGPVLALELRLRWLEAILLGVRQDVKPRTGKEKPYELKRGETLSSVAADIQTRLNGVVGENDGLKRFMEHYDQHAHLLTPTFALSGTISAPPPSYENMSPSELEALLSEMEPEIRAAERDMREIEMLEGKGVTGSGKLPDYEALQPRLEALIKAHKEDLVLAASLERRIASLMERHATQVDALSELFISWNDTITETEHKLTKLEREKDERKRLGLE